MELEPGIRIGFHMSSHALCKMSMRMRTDLNYLSNVEHVLCSIPNIDISRVSKSQIAK